ncbi:MAG: polyprenyl synthetase family protein [Deltaproteobacteria bacterium]|nr:polyprenyl synthetase family protein [Deltaproteobacteria bacterium]
MKIEEYLRSRAAEVDAALVELIGEYRPKVEPKLLEAMEYSLVSPGKRIRPILVLAAAEAVGAEARPLLPFACAAEMVHAYSLVHDDLPAMDDDDLRRGRPTNHKVFGEGIAILAGDGLLTEAFAVMSRDRAAPPVERRLAAIRELAAAAGAEGMVGGQTADVLAEGRAADLPEVESIHRRKTGALLRACVRIGALLGGADAASLERLSRYGETIGLAFQVADDLLDEIGDTRATGKQAQRDRARGKATVPALLGVERARGLLRELRARSLADLDGFGPNADPLRGIARTVVDRAL